MRSHVHLAASRCDGRLKEEPVVALSEILQRFRFHGVPGAAAPTGVPVDRTRDIEDELAPVFAALDGVQRRATALVAGAERAAALRRATAVEEADRIVASAWSAAIAARADAAAATLGVAAQERDSLLVAGRVEVERIGRVAEERMPAVAASAVQRVLASLVAPSERPKLPPMQARTQAPKEPETGTDSRPHREGRAL